MKKPGDDASFAGGTMECCWWLVKRADTGLYLTPCNRWLKDSVAEEFHDLEKARERAKAFKPLQIPATVVRREEHEFEEDST